AQHELAERPASAMAAGPVRVDRVVDERLAHPGPDPLPGDDLGERERRGAERHELHRRDPVLVADAAVRRGHETSEQRRVDRVDRSVVEWARVLRRTDWTGGGRAWTYCVLLNYV